MAKIILEFNHYNSGEMCKMKLMAREDIFKYLDIL